MQLTAENLEEMLAAVMADFGSDEDDDMPEPPTAPTLEAAALRVSETLMEQAVESYRDCIDRLKDAEINTLMAIHLNQKIEEGDKERRIRLARTLRTHIVSMGEEIDERLDDLVPAMEAAAAPSEPEPTAEEITTH